MIDIDQRKSSPLNQAQADSAKNTMFEIPIEFKGNSMISKSKSPLTEKTESKAGGSQGRSTYSNNLSVEERSFMKRFKKNFGKDKVHH